MQQQASANHPAAMNTDSSPSNPSVHAERTPCSASTPSTIRLETTYASGTHG
jgi:hypothetical protein